jgi:magnesium transporter
VRLAALLEPDLREMLTQPRALGDALDQVREEDLAEIVDGLPLEEAMAIARLSSASVAGHVLARVSPDRRSEILANLAPVRAAELLAEMQPDDRADALQALAPELRETLLVALHGVDPEAAAETRALVAYPEASTGGMMNTAFFALPVDTRVSSAIDHLRAVSRRGEIEHAYYVYVLAGGGTLAGVVSLREIVLAEPDDALGAVMRKNVVHVLDTAPQIEAARLLARYDLQALPVVDRAGRMLGIVTADDVVDVVEDEATEDIQMLGGQEALERSYLETTVLGLMRKRAPWLAVLFVGEMLTASAMGVFEDEIARAVVLALFVPLIISSGGNSGSQAATLIVRAMALGEVRLSDWWRIMRREVFVGLALGTLLAVVGLVRITAWQLAFHSYGEQWGRVAMTVSLSLVGVVLWGTLAGSMLPFVIRAARLDPATVSAPFVATLVDVSGLVIYFTIARVLLGGTLL